MKNALWMLLMFLSAAGCGVELKQIESPWCESLVLREGKIVGQEAICLLRPPVSPRDLLPIQMAAQDMSLRQRLDTFQAPQSVSQDSSGKKWFLFPATDIKLEANCDGPSPEAGECRWFLRGTMPSNGAAHHLKLQNTLEVLTRNGFREGVVSFESAKDPSPGEYVSISFAAGKITQIEWRHPRDTAEFVPVWAKEPK